MNQTQKECFFHLFNRRGYVLDFSTEGFDRFTQESIGVPLCKKFGLSKGKSLEAFCWDASDEDVLKLFNDLLEYYELNIKDLPNEVEYIPLYNKCKKVIVDIKMKTDSHTCIDNSSKQKKIEKAEVTYIDNSIHIGNNNQIRDTDINGTKTSINEEKTTFANKHPIITGLIVSGIAGLVVGFLFLFSFWKDIVIWIEGLLNG